MPPRYMATVTCPSCGTRFQTPIEQILDVRVDPNAKNRILGGTVNVAVCPSCGTGGALNIPFIYHDPDKEIALLYLPVESGRGEVERQQAAGRLARQLMDAMPPEERKGYLLQPETFISMDTLVKRVLELEGVSEEEMAHSQRQREFLGTLVEADEDQWPALLEEHADLVDEGLFAFLEYVMQLSGMTGQQMAEAEKLQTLHEYLITQTELGRMLAKRSEVIRVFAEDPTRESLLEALIASPDTDAVQVLVQSGLSLMDYGFFQQLVRRIDETEDPEEQARLRKLRRSVLDMRDELMSQSENEIRERGLLLAKLLSTEDPVRMASSHLSELDELFFAVMGSELEQAQQKKATEDIEALQRVGAAVNRVIEGNLPPEVAFTRRLMAIPDDQRLEQMLQQSRELLTPPYMQFLEALQVQMQEQGQEEAAARLTTIRAIAQKYAPAAPAPAQAAQQQPGAPAQQEPPAPPQEEQRTPSGLIIAKH